MTAGLQPPLVIDRHRFDAVIFDLDGVVTRTAQVHAAAWKQLFDEYREHRLRQNLDAFEPFDAETDYREYVDGKSRYDGIQAFLEARGIETPYGQPDDPPDAQTVCGLANRKNSLFQERLRAEGVGVYESTVRLIHDLRAAGFKVAIISASRNCAAVLRAARLQDLFDARVDGEVAAQLQLRGKPQPDVFVEAARRLGVECERAVVVEDAIAGVQAGRRGGFGLVIGIERTGESGRLQHHGADRVVRDLVEVTIADGPTRPELCTADLPSALDAFDSILGREHGRLAVFLDYDGTLTPIVSRPEQAVLSPEMRAIVGQLAARIPVAVVSGRGLKDVQRHVGLDQVVYAGSHGFEMAGPRGLRKENEDAQVCLPSLDKAEALLTEQLKAIPGVQIERKKYSMAVHYRNVDEKHRAAVSKIVGEVAARFSNLRQSGGKMIHELQPRIDWHKGRAVLWLLDALDLNHPDVLPLYLGDDVTDEDAFRALRERGVGIVVRDDPRPTAAQYALENPAEVGAFLRRLATHSTKAIS